MSIEQKLSEFEIENILVVDDALDNIIAAKKYFESLPINTDYASSALDAKNNIKQSVLNKSKYDLVITDLEMETPDAGLEVVRESLAITAYVTIATGKNYHMSESHAHGPNTTVLPINESVKGKKDDARVWEEVLRYSMEHVSSDSIQNIYKSEIRYERATGKKSDLFKKFVFEMYK